MSDQYPESFEVEIERDKLCRYLRRQWLLVASAPIGMLSFFFGFAWTMGDIKREQFESVIEVVIAVLLAIGLAGTFTVLIVGLLYGLLFRRIAKKEADSLQVSVEGSFLRIREGVSNVRDRKLHFRAITDYVYFQDSMMRDSDIAGIELSTMSGGQNSTIKIRGIKNALQVRDMLSEIDRQREDS